MNNVHIYDMKYLGLATERNQIYLHFVFAEPKHSLLQSPHKSICRSNNPPVAHDPNVVS